MLLPPNASHISSAPVCGHHTHGMVMSFAFVDIGLAWLADCKQEICTNADVLLLYFKTSLYILKSGFVEYVFCKEHWLRKIHLHAQALEAVIHTHGNYETVVWLGFAYII